VFDYLKHLDQLEERDLIAVSVKFETVIAIAELSLEIVVALPCVVDAEANRQNNFLDFEHLIVLTGVACVKGKKK